MSTQTTAAENALEPQTAAEETVAPEELAAIVDQRAATYTLIARLFRVEADAALIAQLQAGRYPVSSENDQLDRGWYLLARAATNFWENSVEELAVDFAHTFIGHGTDAYSAAYPYESVRVGEKRLVMQDARDEVLAIYKSEGLEKAGDWKDNEDHIASELEFLQVLCERCAAALRAGDVDRAASVCATQRNFIEDHLETWVPQFCKEVRFYAKGDLYQAAAWLLEGFLAEERAFLDEVLAA